MYSNQVYASSLKKIECLKKALRDFDLVLTDDCDRPNLERLVLRDIFVVNRKKIAY